METIHLSLSAQVAVGTFFMKSPVHGNAYNQQIYKYTKWQWTLFSARNIPIFDQKKFVMIMKKILLVRKGGGAEVSPPPLLYRNPDFAISVVQTSVIYNIQYTYIHNILFYYLLMLIYEPENVQIYLFPFA